MRYVNKHPYQLPSSCVCKQQKSKHMSEHLYVNDTLPCLHLTCVWQARKDLTRTCMCPSVDVHLHSDLGSCLGIVQLCIHESLGYSTHPFTQIEFPDLWWGHVQWCHGSPVSHCDRVMTCHSPSGTPRQLSFSEKESGQIFDALETIEPNRVQKRACLLTHVGHIRAVCTGSLHCQPGLQHLCCRWSMSESKRVEAKEKRVLEYRIVWCYGCNLQ